MLGAVWTGVGGERALCEGIRMSRLGFQVQMHTCMQNARTLVTTGLKKAHLATQL